MLRTTTAQSSWRLRISHRKIGTPTSRSIDRALGTVQTRSVTGVSWAPPSTCSLTPESLSAVCRPASQDLARHARDVRFVTGQPVSYTHLRAHETVLDLVCR